MLAAIAVYLGGYLRVDTGSYSAAFWSAAVLLLMGAVSTSFISGAPRLRTTKLD